MLSALLILGVFRIFVLEKATRKNLRAQTNSYIPVYIIVDANNIERPKNVQFLKHILNEFEVTEWAAVPANAVMDPKYAPYVTDNTFHQVRRGAIGCALAHITLLEHLLRENVSHALVFESDAEITPSFPYEFTQFRRHLPNDFDFGQLLHHVTMQSKRKGSVNAFVMKSYMPYGTVGYYITLRGIRKLLPAIRKIWTPIDEMFRDSMRKGIVTSYMPVKDLVTMSYNHTSTIWNTKKIPKTTPCHLFPNRWNKHGAEMLNILKAFHNITERMNVEYSLIGGSLIGYVRHDKQPIPWDDDIDVFIMPKDALQVQHEIEKAGFCHANLHLGFKMFRCDSPRIGNYMWRYPMIDIFTISRYTTRKTMIFPTRLDVFGGVTTRVPTNPITVLHSIYGKNVLNQCKSSYWNHELEQKNSNPKTFPCTEIIQQCTNP